MRPLKLTVEAFGPFAGKEIIDFTQIEDQQLFGIYGETGSGKSSIFEAIAFALFGKGLKKDLDDLRSDHSDMNTFVKWSLSLKLLTISIWLNVVLSKVLRHEKTLAQKVTCLISPAYLLTIYLLPIAEEY